MPASETRSPIAKGLQFACHDVGRGLAVVGAAFRALFWPGRPPAPPPAPAGEEAELGEAQTLLEKIGPFPSHD